VVVSKSGPRKLRVGAVSYLNTKPLIYRFDEWARDMELVLDVPSRLADRLASCDLDVALVPSIECFQNTGYTIVSDACIACRGPVLSVKLLSRVPIDQIRSLALDEGSRTSVALVQILLRRRFDLTPSLTPLPIGEGLADVKADGVLLIGDRAIHALRDLFPVEWDLGGEWCETMGVPFVFAVWAARQGIDTQRVAAVLRQTRDAGLAHLEQIAAAAAPEAGLDVAACLSYLRDNLHFTLGPLEQQGLRLFLRHAADLGFVPGECRSNTLRLMVP
jgi:chorismate dehydratase